MTSWKRTRAASEQSGGLAEGVGFEPTVGFPTLDFESSALNRTQPPFPFAKKNVEHRASNESITQIRSLVWLDLAWRVPSRAVPALANGVSALRGQKM